MTKLICHSILIFTAILLTTCLGWMIGEFIADRRTQSNFTHLIRNLRHETEAEVDSNILHHALEKILNSSGS